MASQTIDIDRPFNGVFRALSLKDQRKALRGAMRREGNRLKKQAADNLRASGITAPGKTYRPSKKKRYAGDPMSLSKGIRLRVYPEDYGAGFMLSVKPHKKQGYHTNRKGKEKPVLMWAEDGTEYRKTKTKTKFFVRKRKGHVTGRMKRYGFIRKTDEQATQVVEQNLFTDFQGNIEKAARKQGLL